jgi:hypothetical protein
VYETFYNKDCTKAIVKSTDGTKANQDVSADLSGRDYSIFDSTALPLVLRSFNLSTSSSNTFNVMVPINGNYSNYVATCTSSTSLSADNDDDKKVISALDECDQINANGEVDGVATYLCKTITLGLDATMTGSTYTYTYATVADSAFNPTRAVLMKISSPLSFSLGTINYTLASLSYAQI